MRPTIIDASGVSTMADKPKRKNWIKGAIKHPGAFKAKAEAAGETTREYAAQHAGDSGALGKQARLAQTLMGMHKKSPRKLKYDKSGD